MTKNTVESVRGKELTSARNLPGANKLNLVCSQGELNRKQKRDFSELSSNIAHAEDDDFETKPPARKKQDNAASHFNGDYSFVVGKHAKAGPVRKEVKPRKSSSFKCGLPN